MHKFEYIDRYRAAWHFFFFCRASYKTTHLQCWSRSSYWLNREIKLPTEELVPTAVSSLQDQTATAILSAKPLLTSHIYFIRASASKWHSGWPKPPSLAAACLLWLPIPFSSHVPWRSFPLGVWPFPFPTLWGFFSLKFLVNQSHFTTQEGLSCEPNCKR